MDFMAMITLQADTLAKAEAAVASWKLTKGARLMSLSGQQTSTLIPAVAGTDGALTKIDPPQLDETG